MDKERRQAAEEKALRKDYEEALAALTIATKRLYGEMEVCMYCGMLCDQTPGDEVKGYTSLYWECDMCDRKACANCVFSDGRRTMEWGVEYDGEGLRGLVLPCSCKNEGSKLTCFCPELNRLYQRQSLKVMPSKRPRGQNRESCWSSAKRVRVEDDEASHLADLQDYLNTVRPVG